MVRSILIAGCGYVGSALALRLLDRGFTVWGLRRHTDALPPGVVPLSADLTDPASLSDLPGQVDQLVYAASAGAPGEDAYRGAYVRGPQNLLTALEGSGASLQRVVFVSSTGVYGQKEGEWVSEATPPEPSNWRGRLLLEGEEVVRRFAPGAVVIRLGGIYGPGRTRLIDRVRSGEARCPPDPVYSNRIHRDDCARAVEHILDHPDPRPLYLGVDREPARLCSVYRWLARELGVPEPEGSGEESAGRRSNKRCSSRRLVESGFEFLYPTFREGYGALLAGVSGPGGPTGGRPSRLRPSSPARGRERGSGR